MLEKLHLLKKGQRELIYSIVDIYNGKLEGWEHIAEFCCFKQKKTALVLFKCMLQFIDWSKTRSFNEAMRELKTYDSVVVTKKLII